MRALAVVLAATLASPTSAREVRPIVPAMVTVPAGSFNAGSTPAETGRFHYPAVNAAREQPARVVSVAHRFAIARTEVTRDAFARFVAATGWHPDGGCGYLADGPGNRWVTDTAHDWLHPGFAQTGHHPVVCVALADAQAYARWLSERTGRHFRLPSNTEWEYAARAGSTTMLPWSDRHDAAVCRYANVADRRRARANAGDPADPAIYVPCGDGFAETAPVGSFRANAWGVHDMIGNVWEWTADCLNPDQRDAPAGTAPRATGECTSHIDRGASWTNTPKYVRVAAQHPDIATGRTAVLGFRLVEDLP